MSFTRISQGRVFCVQTSCLSHLGISEKNRKTGSFTEQFLSVLHRQESRYYLDNKRKQGNLLIWCENSFTEPKLKFSSSESAVFHNNLQSSGEIMFTHWKQCKKHKMNKVTLSCRDPERWRYIRFAEHREAGLRYCHYIAVSSQHSHVVTRSTTQGVSSWEEQSVCRAPI